MRRNQTCQLYDSGELLPTDQKRYRHTVKDWADVHLGQKDKEDEGFLKKVLATRPVMCVITSVVLLDVFLTFYSLFLSSDKAEPSWLFPMNVVCILLLGLEVVLRAVALGKTFISERMNLFDLFVVVLCGVEMVVQTGFPASLGRAARPMMKIIKTSMKSTKAVAQINKLIDAVIADFINNFIGDILMFNPKCLKINAAQGKFHLNRAYINSEVFRDIHSPITVAGGLIESVHIRLDMHTSLSMRWKMKTLLRRTFTRSKDNNILNEIGGGDRGCPGLRIQIHNILLVLGPGQQLQWTPEVALAAKSKLVDLISRRLELLPLKAPKMTAEEINRDLEKDEEISAEIESSVLQYCARWVKAQIMGAFFSFVSADIGNVVVSFEDSGKSEKEAVRGGFKIGAMHLRVTEDWSKKGAVKAPIAVPATRGLDQDKEFRASGFWKWHDHSLATSTDGMYVALRCRRISAWWDTDIARESLIADLLSAKETIPQAVHMFHRSEILECLKFCAVNELENSARPQSVRGLHLLREKVMPHAYILMPAKLSLHGILHRDNSGRVVVALLNSKAKNAPELNVAEGPDPELGQCTPDDKSRSTETDIDGSSLWLPAMDLDIDVESLHMQLDQSQMRSIRGLQQYLKRWKLEDDNTQWRPPLRPLGLTDAEEIIALQFEGGSSVPATSVFYNSSSIKRYVNGLWWKFATRKVLTAIAPAEQWNFLSQKSISHRLLNVHEYGVLVLEKYDCQAGIREGLAQVQKGITSLTSGNMNKLMELAQSPAVFTDERQVLLEAFQLTLPLGDIFSIRKQARLTHAMRLQQAKALQSGVTFEEEMHAAAVLIQKQRRGNKVRKTVRNDLDEKQHNEVLQVNKTAKLVEPRQGTTQVHLIVNVIKASLLDSPAALKLIDPTRHEIVCGEMTMLEVTSCVQPPTSAQLRFGHEQAASKAKAMTLGMSEVQAQGTTITIQDAIVKNCDLPLTAPWSLRRIFGEFRGKESDGVNSTSAPATSNGNGHDSQILTVQFLSVKKKETIVAMFTHAPLEINLYQPVLTRLKRMIGESKSEEESTNLDFDDDYIDLDVQRIREKFTRIWTGRKQLQKHQEQFEKIFKNPLLSANKGGVVFLQNHGLRVKILSPWTHKTLLQQRHAYPPMDFQIGISKRPLIASLGMGFQMALDALEHNLGFSGEEPQVASEFPDKDVAEELSQGVQVQLNGVVPANKPEADSLLGRFMPVCNESTLKCATLPSRCAKLPCQSSNGDGANGMMPALAIDHSLSEMEANALASEYGIIMADNDLTSSGDLEEPLASISDRPSQEGEISLKVVLCSKMGLEANDRNLFQTNMGE